MSQGRNRWLAAGAPQHGIAQPVTDLAHTLRGYGLTIGTIGNAPHMFAAVAEDHTWYSETGWPAPAVLGWVYACDVMPGGGPDLPTNAQLMGQIVSDRTAEVPGTQWIKYVNWTDETGDCWHEAWDPGHRRGSSGDRGHGHISSRTDFLHWGGAAGYDPVARWRAAGGGGGIVIPAQQPAGGPAFPGRLLRVSRPMLHGRDARMVQQRLYDRGWRITVDDWYGPKSAGVVRAFQEDSMRHGWSLTVDSIVGPNTWHALWARPVTR